MLFCESKNNIVNWNLFSIPHLMCWLSPRLDPRARSQSSTRTRQPYSISCFLLRWCVIQIFSFFTCPRLNPRFTFHAQQVENNCIKNRYTFNIVTSFILLQKYWGISFAISYFIFKLLFICLFRQDRVATKNWYRKNI